MKILGTTIGFRPQNGELETHLDDLCEYLRRHGHQVYVMTYQPLMTKVKAPRRGNVSLKRITRCRIFHHHQETNYRQENIMVPGAIK